MMLNFVIMFAVVSAQDVIDCRGTECDLTLKNQNCVKMYNLKLWETAENRITDLRYGSCVCLRRFKNQ